MRPYEQIENAADRIPVGIRTERTDIIEIVENWVNAKHGGDTTVDDIVAATIQALVNEGWTPPKAST